MTPQWTPEHRTSHSGLLEPVAQPRGGGRQRFNAIVVPTNRPVRHLSECLDLASRTKTLLIVACSKYVTKHEVIEAAAQKEVEVYAVDLSPRQVNPFAGIFLETSVDKELLTLTSGLTRDLSAKRNLGLVVARICGWERLMFLDDDILKVSDDDVAALAAALDDHNVSVLIPDEYPDNSVVCHANRLSGRDQGRFASGGAMGVRCYRDNLGFFPNIYNEDWFFFSEDANQHKIAKVGQSQQKRYYPFRDPDRAVKEEFGDLLAEGLYARLEHLKDLPGVTEDYWKVDEAYWHEFIKTREDFLDGIARRLADRLTSGDYTEEDEQEIRDAQVSVSAARGQLALIDRELCQKFINLWQQDLEQWRRYVAPDSALPHLETAGQALEHLGLDYEYSPKSR